MIVDESVLDRELNSEQADAAKKIDGPMLILAGAGSGKTRAITFKIAHLVSQYSVSSDRILAVTFTNKAAREMKERLFKILGERLSFDWMGTFHSVCLRLLRMTLKNAAVIQTFGNLWYNSNFSIYDDDDQRRLLKDILKADLGENLEPSEVKKVHGAISRFKNSVIRFGDKVILQTPEIAIQNAQFADQERYARYYKEYQRRLLEANAMDFDDLLFNTVLILQKVPQITAQLQLSYQYVVVDEYQDTNDVQYELLKLLINENKNVTVVGDDDQSIYGWRGANIQIIRNFHRDFSPVTIVKLERNYRSTANIVQGAGSVIAKNIRPKEMEKVVYSKQEPGDKIRVRYFSGDREEAAHIAEVIARAGSANYAKTAVFYRTNAQSRILEKALNDSRIPSVIFGGTRFWDRKEVKDILAYLRILANEKDDAAHLRIINTPSRAIGKSSVENIMARVHQGDGTFWEMVVAESNSASRAAPKFRNFVVLVNSWKALLKNGEIPLPLFVEKIIADIQYKEFLRKEDDLTADDRIGNIEEMVNAIREFDEDHPGGTLEDFLQDISLLTDADKKVDDSKDRVTLMTIHMAKGLEFNTVHIAGCDEEIFPLVRGSAFTLTEEAREQMEEERRLFYVGCTRAEKKLYLYHAENRFFQGTFRPFMPSRFLKELDPSVVEFTPCVETRTAIPSRETPYSYGNSRNTYSSNSYGRSSTSRTSTTRATSGGTYGSARQSIRQNDKRIVYKNPIKVDIPKGPRVVYDEYSENPYHPGARVRHNKHGLGIIQKCYGTGDNARVDVRFNDGMVRTIILKYGALEVLG